MGLGGLAIRLTGANEQAKGCKSDTVSGHESTRHDPYDR